jgi:peroxiredoxin
MASWCGVCAAEEGSIAALARDHEVIAIASSSGGAPEVSRWIETTELRALRVVADPRSEIAERWGVSAFPTTFFLDRSGAIRHVEVGYTTEIGMRLRAWLAAR